LAACQRARTQLEAQYLRKADVAPSGLIAALRTDLAKPEDKKALGYKTAIQRFVDRAMAELPPNATKEQRSATLKQAQSQAEWHYPVDPAKVLKQGV